VKEVDMKIVDLKSKTAEQLSSELLSLKKEQFNLRFQQATGQLENTSNVRKVRKSIAQVKTLLRQKANETKGES
jgi:large subunit ribosomal protein L29